MQLKRLLRLGRDIGKAGQPSVDDGWPAVAGPLSRALDKGEVDEAFTEASPEEIASLLAGYRTNALSAEERRALECALSSSPTAYWHAVSALSFAESVESAMEQAPGHLVERAVADAVADASKHQSEPFFRRWIRIPDFLGGWRGAAAFAVLAVAVWPILSLLEMQSPSSLDAGSPITSGGSLGAISSDPQPSTIGIGGLRNPAGAPLPSMGPPTAASQFSLSPPKSSPPPLPVRPATNTMDASGAAADASRCPPDVAPAAEREKNESDPSDPRSCPEPAHDGRIESGPDPR